jgi:hypothetical protein
LLATPAQKLDGDGNSWLGTNGKPISLQVFRFVDRAAVIGSAKMVVAPIRGAEIPTRPRKPKANEQHQLS